MAEIYFPDENIFSKISEILSKNGIEEDVVEAALKTEPSFIGITFKMLKNLALQKITEETFVLNLQKEFKISDQTAKNILKEIKEKIIPYSEKISTKNESISQSFTNQKQDKMTAPLKKIPKFEKSARAEKPVSAPKGADKYRESIEE